jgi:hypothetical protein
MAAINFELRRSRTLSTGGQVRPFYMAQSKSHRLDLGQKSRQSPTDVIGMLTFWIKAAAADSALSYKNTTMWYFGSRTYETSRFFSRQPGRGSPNGLGLRILDVSDRHRATRYRKLAPRDQRSMLGIDVIPSAIV